MHTSFRERKKLLECNVENGYPYGHHQSPNPQSDNHVQPNTAGYKPRRYLLGKRNYWMYGGPEKRTKGECKY